jgi:hypothetical protein
MIDRAAPNDSLADLGETPPPEASLELTSLEQRLRRLEDAVAVIQDAHQLEERVVERLTDRLSRTPPSKIPTGLLIEAPRTMLPAVPLVAQAVNPASVPNFTLSRRWLLSDLITDARAMFAMFADPRYHLGWQVRVVVFGLLLAILTSYIWFPGLSFLPGFLSTIIDKIVDLVLAYALYKVLSRETRRYRETAPDLPAHLRL